MSGELRRHAADRRSELSRRHIIKIAGAGTLGLVAAACGESGKGGGGGGGKLPTVRLQALDGGMGALSLKVIEEQGFDTKHGFKGDFQYVPADASAQNFLQHESEVTLDLGPPDVAIMKNKGNDVVMFSGNVTGHHVRVIAKGDTPYNSIEDLVGHKIGHYGDDSTGTLTISMLLDQYHNKLNFSKDFELVLAEPPALVHLLDSGQVDAMVNFQPHIARASTTIESGVKTVYDPASDWQQQIGGTLWTTTVASFRNWIKKHPDRARSVLDAWSDGADFINSNPDQIVADRAYHEILGLNQAGLKAFEKYLEQRNRVAAGFTDKDISSINKSLELMAKQGVLFKKAPKKAAQRLDELIK